MAQEVDDLNAILKRVNELRLSGQYDAALAEAQKLEIGIRTRFGTSNANYAIALGTLAVVYQEQQKGSIGARSRCRRKHLRCSRPTLR